MNDIEQEWKDKLKAFMSDLDFTGKPIRVHFTDFVDDKSGTVKSEEIDNFINSLHNSQANEQTNSNLTN